MAEQEEKKDLLPDLELDLGEEKILTEKHLKILEAAVRVFSEKGFSASRTSEVAKEAGVSEGTIFNYFKTKKDLLRGLLVPLTARVLRPFVLAGIEKVLNGSKDRELADVLRDLMVDRSRLIRNNLPLVKTMAVEAAYHPELLEPIKQVLPKVVELATAFVREEQQRGNFREDIDPTRAMRVFMSMVFGYVLMSETLGDVFSFEEEEKEIDLILDLYLNGVQVKK
ncbi:TetR/AcrR family transcriptional regulator [Tumebacillus sp. DT12]|uniref:TetR/AcrR family transcriptional regulator n=1 Tax=Tumebacillus lacus TaxID=2995335 RepID=A0ABT3X072_9BACL|nr:TetR/AcrR family transcriptional regulator [Tumebacillus lacus]MCX7570301.1 TetR/AcrR family transcriptional regulator [Tumebacillus lacus]